MAPTVPINHYPGLAPEPPRKAAQYQRNNTPGLIPLFQA